MRIVIWNCNMGLHSKIGRLIALKPDIAIISECSSPSILTEKAGLFMPPQYEWVTGNSDHKGLAVLAFGEYRIKPIPRDDDGVRFVLPVQVEGPVSFPLMAVWAFNQSDGIKHTDPGPVSRALKHYRSFLASGPAIIAGDFNNHFYFDQPGRGCNHANTLGVMDELGMFSAYHEARKEPAGEESTPTYYWYRDIAKPYHIDYCFLANAWKPRLRTLTVGSPAEWLSHSDHMPLVVDLE